MKTNKPYKPRTNSSADQIVKFLTGRSEATRGDIECAVNYRDYGQKFGVHAVWHALEYLVERGVITRVDKLNPYTKRMAYHYTIAQN